jgi:hypothetical protein
MSAQRSTKPKHQRAVRTTVSFPPRVYDALAELVKRGGFTGPSDYFAAKVRHDAKLDAFADSSAVSAQ